MRHNSLLKVPPAWVDKIHKVYLDAQKGGPKKVKMVLPFSDLDKRYYKGPIKKALDALYAPHKSFRLRVTIKHMPAALGSTSPPKMGRSVDIALRPKMSNARTTIRHELQHVIQYLGDMALTVMKGSKHRGAFGRPKKRTTRALRARKDLAKKGIKPLSKTAWYYHSPSEVQPHITDAADSVVRKLMRMKHTPTTKDVNATIRYVVKKRPIFSLVPAAVRRDHISDLYGEVIRRLEAMAQK